MDILLRDGTTINNATVDDVKKLADMGFINSHDMAIPATGCYTEEYNNHNITSDEDFFSRLKYSDMLNACNELCKDNDSIPPEHYDGTPEVDFARPGMSLIKEMIDSGNVVDCSSEDFCKNEDFQDVAFDNNVFNKIKDYVTMQTLNCCDKTFDCELSDKKAGIVNEAWNACQRIDDAYSRLKA